jgi:hypothetical protein
LRAAFAFGFLRAFMIRKQGKKKMKLVSTALLAAGLLALGACGGGAANNTATTNTGDDVYNVAPDDLGTNDTLGNLSDNAVSENVADANATAGNEAGNAE